ncbi:MAG: hypothetical protein LBI81_01595 [Puniceicoccales bacterium]|jgi:hypothetical protein|nr:hypothetical protein [Puniceicoccales bacterium]
MSISPNGKHIVSDECSAWIIIDGEMHQMNKVKDLEYTHNYKRSAGRHKATYYYEVDYKEKSTLGGKFKSERSKLYNLTISNRYVIGFESNRGIPGSTCTLLGRGFEEGDNIEINGIPCETTFVSPNALSFAVPLLNNCGKYHAKLVSDNGDLGVGDFTVDPIALHANLSKIELSSGEKQILIITTDIEAPKTGILVDVTTNIWDSIIMKDIFIPAGARSAAAVIQGGTPGSGMLYLTANGFDELKIPLEIVPSRSVRSSQEQVNDEEFSDEEFLTLK